jgi:hypothetical protein
MTIPPIATLPLSANCVADHQQPKKKNVSSSRIDNPIETYLPLSCQGCISSPKSKPCHHQAPNSSTAPQGTVRRYRPSPRHGVTDQHRTEKGARAETGLGWEAPSDDEKRERRSVTGRAGRERAMKPFPRALTIDLQHSTATIRLRYTTTDYDHPFSASSISVH